MFLFDRINPFLRENQNHVIYLYMSSFPLRKLDSSIVMRTTMKRLFRCHDGLRMSIYLERLEPDGKSIFTINCECAGNFTATLTYNDQRVSVTFVDGSRVMLTDPIGPCKLDDLVLEVPESIIP